MQVTSLEIKNFRCFSQYSQNFTAPITLITGANGSGKTSILEALFYNCFLKSFRTSHSNELIQQGAAGFFIKTEVICQEQPLALQVGYQDGERVVKIDGKITNKYKDLLDRYRAVAFMEDDMALIKGYPEIRRTFIDQVAVTLDPAFAQTVAAYRKIVRQRNALLAQSASCNPTSYELWSAQLWNTATKIRETRQRVIESLVRESNEIIKEYFGASGPLAIEYQCAEGAEDKTLGETLDRLCQREQCARRTLFGSHLDDIIIMQGGNALKVFASRGQQKLVTLLLKIAQVRLLNKKSVFLIDDFMTDFDEERLKLLLALIVDCKTHLFLTVPCKGSIIERMLHTFGYEHLELT